MPSISRTALFDGPGLPFRHTELPVSEPRGEEILVRVRLCTICGSDLHTVAGRRSEPTPCILGHEIVGCIESFGPFAPRRDLRGHELREGDRITWTSAASCGRCFFCLHELPQKCENIFKYGHESIGCGRPLAGGFASYCVLQAGSGIVRIPDELADAVACPANCATATVAAALRAAGGCRDKSVLIQGAGMLGLTACAMASSNGATSIICADLNTRRLQAALRFGATRVLRPAADELRDAVAASTNRRGVDIVVELSGAAQAATIGLELLRIGGSAIWVGAVFPGPEIPIKPEFIVRRWLTVRGVHNYAPADLLAAIEFLTANHGRFPFAEMVTGPYPLRRLDEAFRRAQSAEAVRVAVRPDVDGETST